MYRSVYRTVLLSALVAMLFGGAAAPAFAASLTPLGDLPGGTFSSSPKGVSADGSVVVGVSSSGSSNEAFRWTAASGMVGLGSFHSSPESQALGVSADGSTIVGSARSARAGDGSEAFRWTAASGMVNLGDFPAGVVNTGGSAATGDGSVVVGGALTRPDDGPAYGEAFRWTEASGLVRLGDLPGGAFESIATDVTSDGSTIVGHSDSVNGIAEAFRWTAASGMVGLGDLPGGDFYSQAFAVSDDGSTVVGKSRSASSVGYEAFRWTEASGMVGLGDLPGGSFDGIAWDVSADGSTVVGVSNSIGDIFVGQKAFRWTSARGMEPLWDVLLANGIDPAADGWTTLISANGVSADGNTIVGSGIRYDHVEAFVAVIPEPTSLSLIGLAVPALLRRRQRVNNKSVK
jgi:probable HAF family extracellular repeat protein